MPRSSSRRWQAKSSAQKRQLRIRTWIVLGAVALPFAISYAERIFAVSQSKITGIARFKDGDSGFVRDTEIRLHCLDAAECDTAAGRRAAQFAWREIDGERLSCTPRQDRLSWGSVVVSCDLETGPNRGRDAARLLVDARHARYDSASCAIRALRW